MHRTSAHPLLLRSTALGLALALTAALLALAAPHPADAQSTPQPSSADYEVWALDQGRDVNEIVIFSADHEVVDRIDFAALLGEDDEGGPVVDTPHMIDFTSDFAYAFVASTRSGNVTVIRTDDRAIIDVIPTGATAHFAGVTPDDRAVWVANIGAKTLTEITIDTHTEEFAIGRELDLTTDPAYPEVYRDRPRAEQPGPVCHRYTADSAYAYVTLGPSAEGGLVVVDLGGEDSAPHIHRAFDPAEVKANCGVGLSADGATMYANFGSPDPAVPGEWYTFDTATHELTGTFDSHGADAHGLRVSPDGTELWMLNRQTSNVVVFDTATNEVIAELDDIGESPDILDFSPDGSLVYVTLRGPNPRSGGSAVHPIAGDTPGVAIIDTATRELVDVLQPNDDIVDPELEGDGRLSDFHGIGVRQLASPTEVTRLAGSGRIETALAISQASFGEGEATGAVLARADDYPDALAGAPLAADVGGPVLLTGTDALAPGVAAELRRLLPAGATVHVLGGPAAISPQVAAAVEELGFTVKRVAGATRFETAIAIAGELGDPDLQLLTTGLAAPDALAAGAAAAAEGGAVLLTADDDAHPATTAYLSSHEARRVAIGGPASRAHPDAEPLVGSSRVETAVAVAETFFDGAAVVGLARADDFPDALAGGAHVGALGGPLLLTQRGSLHDAVADYVCDRADDLTEGFSYGGTAALAASTVEALANRIDGEGCAAEPLAFTAAHRTRAGPLTIRAAEDALICHLS